MKDCARVALAVALALACTQSPSAAAPDKPAPPAQHLPVGEARAEAFLKVLAAPVEEQRRFVQENFTQAAIDRRGLDGAVAFLKQVREDLGDAPPVSARGFGDRIEFGVHTPSGEDMRFTVMLSPPPESKINGFTIGPDESAAPPPSVAEAELPKAIGALMDKRASGGFSGAVIVAKRGEPVFAQAYGEADRGRHLANTLDTPFNLASDNKMFTAVLIAQLLEQGQLALEDKVGKFLPEWPQAEVRDKVSIENLLTHTSGLGEYWNDKYAARAESLDTAAEFGELFADEAPAAEPGKEFKYSNNGYVLLGLIAERITGKDYYQLVRERIYQPAGMAHSDHYLKSDAKAGFALGYDQQGNPTTPKLALRGSPAGGGYASARDLLRFASALEGGKLVGKDTLARMTTGHAKMGEDMAYGYGFGVTAGRERHYGHDGGSPGANASFEVFPQSGYVVIVLSNQGQGAREVAQALVGMVLARK